MKTNDKTTAAAATVLRTIFESKASVNEEDDGVIFVLGYWANPYRANDKEYFWFGTYDGMADAKAMFKRKQERGQPTRFTNWVKGTAKYFKDIDKFKAAAKKVGLNPNLDNYESVQQDNDKPVEDLDEAANMPPKSAEAKKAYDIIMHMDDDSIEEFLFSLASHFKYVADWDETSPKFAQKLLDAAKSWSTVRDEN